MSASVGDHWGVLQTHGIYVNNVQKVQMGVKPDGVVAQGALSLELPVESQSVVGSITVKKCFTAIGSKSGVVSYVPALLVACAAR